MPDAYKNILIIKPSALGDIVQALPALGALRRSFPDAEISWLVRPEFAPLIENHPQLTRTILFDRKFLGQAWFHPGAFASLLSFLRNLRRSEFDAVFDFQGLFRTAFFARISGCKKSFGLATAREFSRFFYTFRVNQPPNSRHVVDYYMNLVRTAGAARTDVEFMLPSNTAADKAVTRLLAANNLDSKAYAVLVPGSAHVEKCWPAERFAQLAAKLYNEHKLSILATGSPSEAPLLDKLTQSSDVPITNLAGRTSITELVALLRGAALVVSNDTGPGHIAAALARPLVMIFGKSNPMRVFPYRRQDALVAIDPLSRGHLPDSTNPLYDIRNVTLNDVYQKTVAQLTLHA